jgi:hypothetical protein
MKMESRTAHVLEERQLYSTMKSFLMIMPGLPVSEDAEEDLSFSTAPQVK